MRLIGILDDVVLVYGVGVENAGAGVEDDDALAGVLAGVDGIGPERVFLGLEFVIAVCFAICDAKFLFNLSALTAFLWAIKLSAIIFFDWR